MLRHNGSGRGYLVRTNFMLTFRWPVPLQHLMPFRSTPMAFLPSPVVVWKANLVRFPLSCSSVSGPDVR